MNTTTTTRTNAEVLANVCAIAEKYGFSMFLWEKKPHLYRFYYTGETTAKVGRKPVVFKIRYSVNKRMNMLVKSRHVNNKEKLAEIFTPSNDRECDYEKNIAGLSYKELQTIFAAIGKEVIPTKEEAPKAEAAPAPVTAE